MIEKRVEITRGRYCGKTGKVVNYQDTSHGRLNVVWFGGDEHNLFTDEEVREI